MYTDVGSTESLIDWDQIVSTIIPKSGDLIKMNAVINKSAKSRENTKLLNSYNEIADTWVQAGYNLENIEWYDYYPGEHFPLEVQTTFSNIVNADPKRVWISEVMPGRCAPYHWDVEDHEDEWLKTGELVRYTCFIDTPKFGQLFILDQDHFYNCSKHRIIKWNHYKDYHAGSNCGYEPHYLFHFLGQPR
jgi:hypothetical protein